MVVEDLYHVLKKEFINMTVTILFPGDPSVGIFAHSYDMTIPEIDDEYREETRQQIKKLYEELDQEGRCQVIFQGEYED